MYGIYEEIGFQDPQICERLRGSTKCSSHSQNDISIKCKQCEILICIECVSSFEHQGHTFMNLTECYKEANDNLHAYVWKLENKLLTEIRKEIENTNEDLTGKNTTHDNRARSVNEQRERTLKEMNTTFTSYTTLIDQHAKAIKDPVAQHKQNLESLEQEVIEQIARLKDVLETGTDLEIHDDEDEMKKTPLIEIPKPIEVNEIDKTEIFSCTTVENANLIIDKALQILQSLTLSANEASKEEINKESCVEEESEQVYYASPDENLLKYEAWISSRFKYKAENCSLLHPFNRDSAWIRTQQGTLLRSSKISRITSTGEVKESMKIPGSILSLGIHPVSHQLYGGFMDNTIKAIDTTTGKMPMRIDTDFLPYNIAISEDNRVIVGKQAVGSVYKYKLESGALDCKTDQEYDVRDISICPQTNHVMIACDNEVVVLDTLLAKLFTLNNTDSFASIRSLSAVFGESGNIFVADQDNQKVHVFNGLSGQFAHEIDVTVSDPVKVQRYDSFLWVTCRNPDEVVFIKLSKC